MEDLFGDGKVRYGTLEEGQDAFEAVMRGTELMVHENDGWESYPQLHVVQVTSGDKMGLLSVCGWTDLGDTAKENPIEYMNIWAELIEEDEKTAARMMETLGDAKIWGVIFVLEGHGVVRDTPEEIDRLMEAAKAMGRRLEDLNESREARIVIGCPAYHGNRFYNLMRIRDTDEIKTHLTYKKEEVLELLARSRSHAVAVRMLLALVKAQRAVYGGAS